MKVNVNVRKHIASEQFGIHNERLSKCSRALAAYGDDLPESNLIDLLADAMHWCQTHDHEFERLLDQAGFVPLVFWTKYLCLKAGLRQHCTDVVRFSHGASSGKKVYKSSFIPGLHDICCVFQKKAPHD